MNMAFSTIKDIIDDTFGGLFGEMQETGAAPDTAVVRVPAHDRGTGCVEVSGGRTKGYGQEGDGNNPLSSGFERLDKLTGGLRPGELTIIAGLPGVGKTSLALNMADHVAVKAGAPVAVFSLDTDRQELLARLVSSRSEVSLNNIFSGFLTDADRTLLDRAVLTLYSSPILIDDATKHNVHTIKEALTRLERPARPGLVIVDCLQLLTESQRPVMDKEELRHICTSLKGVATEFDIPVVALYQLPQSWQHKKVVPHPTFLVSEGYTREYNADVIVFIYRRTVCKRCNSPIELCPCQVRHRATFVVARSDGTAGVAQHSFLNHAVKFEDPDAVHAQRRWLKE